MDTSTKCCYGKILFTDLFTNFCANMLIVFAFHDESFSVRNWNSIAIICRLLLK